MQDRSQKKATAQEQKLFISDLHPAVNKARGEGPPSPGRTNSSGHTGGPAKREGREIERDTVVTNCFTT